MIAEALKALQALITDAGKPVELPINDPTRKVWALHGDVHEEHFDPQRKNVVHELTTFASLLSAGPGNTPDLWVDANEKAMTITLPYDHDGTYRDRATFKADISPAFRTVTAAAAMDHQAFMAMAKSELRGCLPEAFVNVMRKIKFEQGVIVDSTVDDAPASRASLTTSTRNNRATVEGQIPDEIPVILPLYDTPFVAPKSTIVCTVDVDATRATIKLTPRVGEIKIALAIYRKTLVELLAAAGVSSENATILFGSPE